MRVVVEDKVEGVSGTRLYRVVDDHGADVPGPRVAVIGMTHGNEPVGGEVLLRLAAEGPAQLVAGSVFAVYANEQAAGGARFTEDGVDLNRLYDRATLDALAQMPRESLCYEETRALELAPLLERCDALLDLHSTSRPSEPFLLVRDDQRHASMALRLGVKRVVTGMHESSILTGGLTSNVGLNSGQHSERLGFTFEAGQHVDPGNVERAWWVTIRLLHALGIWNEAPPANHVIPEVYEVIDRFPQAPGGAVRWNFVDPAVAAYNRVPRQLESFEAVQADEMLVRRSNTVVRAQAPFTMLMPAPDAKPGSDLFYYAQRRHGGLAAGTFRTDDEAQREASAIERMLDLVADDAREGGATTVSFDNRQTLDLCADMVGRTLRLAPEDPHRRITILGRGDWGGGERERRAGQRYRQVMRDAIAAGVPIQRMQVLRGASLGWLDALTSDSMLSLIASRSDAIRLFLSTGQPHTVSVLVVGDLARAIETGKERHCQVAIVVEAATVESDEDTAVVSVIRTGLFGRRSELLSAAANILASVEDDHRQWVATHPVVSARGAALIGPTGEISASPSSLADLRDVVLSLQLNSWLALLRAEVPAPLQLPNRRALGRWLASIMNRTGILDAEALRRLVVRPCGTGFSVDLSQLERLASSDSSEDHDFIVQGRATVMSPRQPVVSTDVDGDSLERWIGWKRFLRAAEVVPDDRGKDLDLVFSEADVRKRVTSWLYEACARAEEAPGDVLVVMAGDGLDPTLEPEGRPSDLHQAHRRVLLEPALRYLRIQHAQGTHVPWIREVESILSERPDSENPVDVLFEAEHGATVNLVMVLERAGDVKPGSLDGWRIECCAVVISDQGRETRADEKLGLFTERLGARGSINLELLQFGRAHCEGLLKQVGHRVVRRSEQQETLHQRFGEHVARWVEVARHRAKQANSLPSARPQRSEWVARHLGIADRKLALVITDQLESEQSAHAVADQAWAQAERWS